jgi:nucleoside-diphosphate-sugar epimerase
MHVLVTGGTGVIGKPVVDRLVDHGHTVRLFSRGAEHDAAQWSGRVEAHTGSVSDPDAVRGSAEGCEAVLHIAGIVAEHPPEVTFEKINIGGTRLLVEEAERAGVRRFVYVSSLGAEHGESDYHRSKRAGEDCVRGFSREWLICRPGNVYGPGDALISLLLKLVRALPVLPVIGGGDQPFQPVWAADLATALAGAVERDQPVRQALCLAGREQTTLHQLIEVFGEITGKHPLRIPVPEWLAQVGTEAAAAVGIDFPVKPDQITMLREGNVIAPGETNALTEVYGVEPIPLREGLAALANSLPEQLPSEGVGKLQRKRYWADIRGSRLGADALFRLVQEEFDTLPPEVLLEVGVEPGTQTALKEDATLSLAIPLRGTIQVRVEEVTPRSATCVTLEGHPLSGVIRFAVEERESLLRFEVRSFTRAAALVDMIGINTVGKPMQRAAWKAVVEEVVRRSGGEAVDGVHAEDDTLDDEEAAVVERWAEELVLARQHREEKNRTDGSGEAAEPE